MLLETRRDMIQDYTAQLGTTVVSLCDDREDRDGLLCLYDKGSNSVAAECGGGKKKHGEEGGGR